jgi:hypothetical protein
MKKVVRISKGISLFVVMIMVCVFPIGNASARSQAVNRSLPAGGQLPANRPTLSGLPQS